MVNKIWNSILSIIFTLLILGIFYNEYSYKRSSRFDYYLYINQKEEISVRMLENEFYVNDTDSLDIPDREEPRSVYKQLAPSKLHLIWFSYNDDKFYEFNGELPYEEIRKELSKDKSNNIEIKFQERNKFQLNVNYKNIKEFTASEVSKPWFDKHTDRETAVFFTNDDRIFTPVITINSSSRLVKAELYNSSKNHRIGYFESFESDSLYDKKLIFDDDVLKTKSVDYIKLELENLTNHDDKLLLNISLDSKALFDILKKHPSKKFDLNITLNEKDEVESVELSTPKEHYNLIFKSDYNTN